MRQLYNPKFKLEGKYFPVGKDFFAFFTRSIQLRLFCFMDSLLGRAIERMTKIFESKASLIRILPKIRS